MKQRKNRTRVIAIGLALAAATTLSGACKRGSTSSATAKSGAASTAADTIVDGCVETNPPADKAAACQACLKKNAINGPTKDGCCGIHDAAGLQLCQAVSACMRTGGSPVGKCNLAGDTSTCFCGKHQADCDVVDKANGPCVAPITAAAARNIETLSTDTPPPAKILERYGDVKYALGRASNIAAIAGALCKTECGLGM